jgi:hypothetical protein
MMKMLKVMALSVYHLTILGILAALALTIELVWWVAAKFLALIRPKSVDKKIKGDNL